MSARADKLRLAGITAMSLYPFAYMAAVNTRKSSESEKKLQARVRKVMKAPVFSSDKLKPADAMYMPDKKDVDRYRKRLKKKGIDIPEGTEHAIIVSEKTDPAILAHEGGHASRKGSLSQKLYGPSVISSTVSMFAAPHMANRMKTRAGRAAIRTLPFAVAAPMLYEEGSASTKAIEYLKEQGATEDEIRGAKARLAGAWATYAGIPLSAALLKLSSAGTMSSMPYSSKPTGTYKGQPMSPDTVKKRVEWNGIPVRVDRPRGFVMKGTDQKGNSWTRKYKYDYGYIPKTAGGDGDGLDVFLGPVKKQTDAYWAVQVKPDGKFDEYKVFLGFPNRDAALAAYREHIPRKLLSGMVTMKVEMMKAMLGIDSNGLRKFAGMSHASFVDELFKIGGLDIDDIEPKDIPEKLHVPRKYVRDKFRVAAESLKRAVQIEG